MINQIEHPIHNFVAKVATAFILEEEKNEFTNAWGIVAQRDKFYFLPDLAIFGCGQVAQKLV